MKNLILKWLGLDNVLRLDDNDYIDDCIANYNSRHYDLDGMASKLEDMDYLTQDLESRGNRWDEISDNLEGIDLEEVAYQHQIDGLKDNLDKVQQLDDRLTELLEGYKLDVRLVQEDF